MRSLTLEQLQNLTLADVSGRPNWCRVRLARQAEIDALAGPIGEGNDRGIISDWRMIALDVMGQPITLVLLGNRGRENYGTSPIVMIDRASGKVRTRSRSIYTLAEIGEGAPPVEHVLHLCALLLHWGWGPALNLPEVSY